MDEQQAYDHYRKLSEKADALEAKAHHTANLATAAQSVWNAIKTYNELEQNEPA